MSKPKILIKIEGGIIQAVFSNTDIEYIVADYDITESEGNIVSGVCVQDDLFKNGQAYKLIDDTRFPLSDEEKLVKNYLKEINF